MHYVSVHRKLRRERGSARDQICVGCGKQAEQWAYQHNSDAELTSEQGFKYTDDLRCYHPMCRSCHRKLDLKNLPPDQRSAFNEVSRRNAILARAARY